MAKVTHGNNGNVTITEYDSDSDFSDEAPLVLLTGREAARDDDRKHNGSGCDSDDIDELAPSDDDGDEVIFVDTSKPDATGPELRSEPLPPATNPAHAAAAEEQGQLVVPGGSEVRDVTNFQDSIATRKRTSGEDDSSVSFGDKVAGTIGNWQYAPSAPSMEDIDMSEPEKRQYEEWLRCTALSERQKFPRHAQWERDLRRVGSHPEFDPVLAPEELPKDELSAAFARKARAALAGGECKANDPDAPALEHDVFVHGVRPDESFSNFSTYVPRTFRRPKTFVEDGDDEEEQRDDDAPVDEAEWCKSHQPSYDEVAELVTASDNSYKVAWRNPTKNVVPERTLWVVSDHSGQSTGKRLEIWGPGCKPRFLGTFGKRKGRVGAPLDINTEFAHVPGRFTVTLIRPNEIGFALHVATSRVRLLLPGRYFLQEHYDNYIGKAPVTLGEATAVTAWQGAPAPIRAWAQRLQVVSVAAGHAAFVMSGSGVFLAPQRSAPWIVDRSNDEEFIAMARLSDRQASCECPFLPSRPRYHIVNLQPDEYVVVRDQRATSIVYRYNFEEPRLNRIHLPSLLFEFDGQVRKITDGTCAIRDLVVLKNNPQDFAVLQDPLGNKRFFEDFTEDIMVLRLPWQLLAAGVPKVDGNYNIGSPGRMVSRVILSPAEWAVVQLRSGEVKLFPPVLADGVPYYFYQPFHTMHGVANRYAKDAQTFELPGYKITVVNLATGELGACRIQNVNMFLNPRPVNPYVFVSPDEFLGKAPVAETHFQAGDLHYVRLNADERCCVIRDGEAILLPSQSNDLAAENKGNGVYIFRARQHLEVVGPRKKTESSYELGPWQFFNVPPGHVGYGTRRGELHVWSEGQHCVNTSNNEQFSGFFQTNVDPVVAKDVDVRCKHAITSKLTITVTYMISDALKTIKCFGGDHPKLHRFVNSLAVSKILELCAKRPPMGFSEADFERKDLQQVIDRSEMSEEKKEATDQAKVSGELLCKLREHPEVIRAGIHIGFAEIQEWKIDPAFMKSSKDIAMTLQGIHCVTEQKRMELEQQKLDNARTLEEERGQQERELIVLEQEMQRAENQKTLSIIESQKQAAAQQARAEADAAAQLARKAAELKEMELAAETDKSVALKRQEQQQIENETNIKQAEAQARMKAAAMTAERMAKAKAEQEAARLELEAAQTMLEASKVKAEAGLLLTRAKAEGEQLLAEASVKAQFPGLSPELRAQCILQQQVLETQRDVAKRHTQVFHTMDPQESQRVYESQVRNMMGISRSLAGFLGAKHLGHSHHFAMGGHFGDPMQAFYHGHGIPGATPYAPAPDSTGKTPIPNDTDGGRMDLSENAVSPGHSPLPPAPLEIGLPHWVMDQHNPAIPGLRV